MTIILNFGMSDGFQKVDFFNLVWPAEMVRVSRLLAGSAEKTLTANAAFPLAHRLRPRLPDRGRGELGLR